LKRHRHHRQQQQPQGKRKLEDEEEEAATSASEVSKKAKVDKEVQDVQEQGRDSPNNYQGFFRILLAVSTARL
jgi:hypothetical protein